MEEVSVLILRFGLVLLLCVSTAACDFGHEEKTAYERVKQEKSIAACEDYLNKWPDGEFTQDVKKLLTKYKMRDFEKQLDLYLAFGRSPSISTAQEYLERFPKDEYNEYFTQAVEQHSEAMKALESFSSALRYVTERPPGSWTSYVRHEIFLRNFIQKYPLDDAIDSKNWLGLDFYLETTESEKRAAEIENMIQQKIDGYESSRKPIEISKNQKTVTIPTGRHAQGKGWCSSTGGDFVAY